MRVLLDANALLRLARRKLEQAGGRVRDRRVFRHALVSTSGPVRVEVELSCEDGATARYTGRATPSWRSASCLQLAF